MSQRVSLTSEPKPIGVSVAEASLNRAIVCRIRPETGCSSHEQVEGGVTSTGGPNPPSLKSRGMTCG